MRAKHVKINKKKREELYRHNLNYNVKCKQQTYKQSSEKQCVLSSKPQRNFMPMTWYRYRNTNLMLLLLLMLSIFKCIGIQMTEKMYQQKKKFLALEPKIARHFFFVAFDCLSIFFHLFI